MSNNFHRKFLFSYPIKLKLCEILQYIEKIINILFFFFLLSHIFKGDSWRVFMFNKKVIVGFFTYTVQARFVISMLRIYQFIPGLVTLTLFQCKGCVRIINGKLFLCFLLLSTIVQTLCGSYIHGKGQKQYVLHAWCVLKRHN